MITLRTSSLTVRVDPDAGALIVHVGPTDHENVLFLGDWRSPIRASRSTSYGSPVMDWLSEYRGGWQELFPNAGADCVVAGTPLPFHGEVSAGRWEVVAEDHSSVTLRCPARLPVVLERTMRLATGNPTLLIEEQVTNEADLPVDFVWGHHPAFDVAPDSRIDLPGRAVRADDGLDGTPADLQPGGVGRWPTAIGRDGREVDLRIVPDAPRQRLVYLPDVADGWAAIRDLKRRRGIGLAWDVATFPHVWLWQEIGGPGFPWYGRARITAMEPQTAWPADGLSGAIGRGQAHRIEPGGTKTSWLTLSLFEPRGPVAGVNRDGTIREE